MTVDGFEVSRTFEKIERGPIKSEQGAPLRRHQSGGFWIWPWTSAKVSGIEAMQERLDRAPKAMRVRRATVEHPFGTLKAWMSSTHFKMKTLEKVSTEMSLYVLAYNLKRVIAILGPQPLMEAMRA